MDIIETISLLDTLRAKATQGEWKWQYGDDGLDVVTAEEGHKLVTFFEKEAERINDTAYLVALYNNYEALRQAALDGERYRKAGEALAMAVEKTIESDKRMGFAPQNTEV